MVIKRMGWKVMYCDMKVNNIKIETYGLKSQEAPPPINELTAFENDLIELVTNIIKFQTVHNQLQGINPTIYQDSNTCRQNVKYVEANKRRV